MTDRTDCVCMTFVKVGNDVDTFIVDVNAVGHRLPTLTFSSTQ